MYLFILLCLREFVDQCIADGLEDVGVLVAIATKLEDALHNGDLRGSGGQSAEGCPVVDDKAATDCWVTTIDSTSHNGDLQKAANFVHILSGRLGVHETSVVGAHCVATDEGILSDGRTEGLHLQNVANHFFGFLAQVSMDQRNVVVADHAIAEGTKSFLYTLNFDAVRERIPEMLELLIGGDGGDDKTMTVADDQATNHARGADGGVDDGDVIGKLLLKDRVEVLGCASCDKAVSIRELGEDADVVTALKTGAKGHMLKKSVVNRLRSSLFPFKRNK